MSILNINVGVMGHVDSGKTAICKCISDLASTASFDKNPQSQKRGITLDLGFSCFRSKMPNHLIHLNKDTLQITLVDCPGHASLFKTVIGGSNIIDIVLLVIDVTHGIQLQTAECIVLAEILKKPVIVALNKIDLLDQTNLENLLEKEMLKISKILSKTKLDIIGLVPVTTRDPERCSRLKHYMIDHCVCPIRSNGYFLFCVDHCFSIKGQGTVMTGTVIQGSLKVNDQILILDLKEVKEVKSIQIFKEPVKFISQGDRAAVLITRLNSKLVERSLICSPTATYDHVDTFHIKPEIVQHYKSEIKSGSKVNLSIGFEVVTATILFYDKLLDVADESLFLESISHSKNLTNTFCLLKCERPIIYLENSVVMALKLSTDPKKKTCRILFYGKLFPYTCVESETKNLKVFRWRTKSGHVERVSDSHVIVRGLLSKSIITNHINKTVSFSTGETGIIYSGFGDSGKIKVLIDNMTPEFKDIVKSKDKQKISEVQVTYTYKKYRNLDYYLK